MSSTVITPNANSTPAYASASLFIILAPMSEPITGITPLNTAMNTMAKRRLFFVSHTSLKM